MKVIIKELNKKGRDALEKLQKSKTRGLARKRTLTEDPLKIELKPRGMPFFIDNLINSPMMINTITAPMHKMMGDYGATTKDYTIEVVKG